MVLSGRGSASPHGRGTLPIPTGVPLPPRARLLTATVSSSLGTPADVCSTLGRESESRKRKAAVVPSQSDYLMMGNEGYFDVSNEESYRISKEIENLRSQLALKKKELNYQQNKKLRDELDLKIEEVECLRKENEELKAQNKDLRNNNKELQDKIDDLTKQNEELQAKNDDLHKNVIMQILEIHTDAKRKDLLQFLGLYSIMDCPHSSDEEGNTIEASSNVAAGLSASSGILEAQTLDAKIQIKALFSQLVSLTQQFVSTDSIQAKDAELATQKEEVKSLMKAYLGEESYSDKKDFCPQKIEDREKLEKDLRATKAILKAVSAEKETAEESLKVVQAELDANKSSLAQALSDRDFGHQVTGKLKEDITELMNEAGTISASLVLAVFKDHYPDLDMSVINKGFKRDAVKAQELIESFKDLVQPAVKQLEFSYWSDDGGSLSSYELGSDAQ